jgi:hypothetical protein
MWRQEIYTILMDNSLEKQPLERPKRKWEIT